MGRWNQLRSEDLKYYEKQLRSLAYPSAFRMLSTDRTSYGSPYRELPERSVALFDVHLLLSKISLGPPHGLDMLTPRDLPEFPKKPWTDKNSNPSLSETVDCLRQQTHELKERFQAQRNAEMNELEEISRGCRENAPNAIQRMLGMTNIRHFLPERLIGVFTVDVDFTKRIALCTIEIPDLNRLSVVKKQGKNWPLKWVAVSLKEKKYVNETLFYGLCLRAAYLVACSDSGEWFDTVAVNAIQNWFDAATGAPRDGIVASLQAPKLELQQLDLSRVDPKVCFRHIRGIATPSIQSVAPIRPILVLNRDDERIIEHRNIDENLESEANLAAMPWDDFEHLVRQLFEWEFGRNGVEVKVTRASRDRGVDAIMFDPDPLRGGKYVLQAKRYTRPVDVAAVRDLYGTVVNEGANRGILVTTSSYGPDSYEFAKDKPISLVDGPNLLNMLSKHGRKYRIDLAEARRNETLLGPA